MNSTTSLMLVALVAIVGTIGFASEAHADLPLTVQTDTATYGHKMEHTQLLLNKVVIQCLQIQ